MRETLATIAAAMLVVCASAMDDEATGVTLASELTGIEAAAPDKHRILADGTFDTYSVEEKQRFAMELYNLLAPDKPVPEMPRRDMDGIPEDERKLLEDRDSKSVMFFVRTMDVLLRTTATTLKLAESETNPTQLEATNAILALMKGQDEIDALREEYMRDRQRRPAERPAEPPGKPVAPGRAHPLDG